MTTKINIEINEANSVPVKNASYGSVKGNVDTVVTVHGSTDTIYGSVKGSIDTIYGSVKGNIGE